jgi:four helix bundle protein
MNPSPSFQELDVWRKAMDLVVRVYEVTGSFPADERFGLVSETRGAARSVPYNIAEGKMRRTTAEYRHFVSVARGSSGELHTQLILASRLGYVSSTVFEELASRVSEVGRMLRALERSLS